MGCHGNKALLFKLLKGVQSVKFKNLQMTKSCKYCYCSHTKNALRFYCSSQKKSETINSTKLEAKDLVVTNKLHIPVLKNEVLDCFTSTNGKTFLDMTFGAGGHTTSLLENITDSHIYALDRDPTAHQIAVDLAKQRPNRITPLLGRFSELPKLLEINNVKPGDLDGILMDLGTSSMQFDESPRGFSLSKDGPLDMRMDTDRFPDQPTAADVVNNLDEADLALIFKKYGEEKRHKKLACSIVEARSAFGKILTTKELAGIIESVCPGAYGLDSLGRYSHPATKIFQAIRIFVNNELNELNSALEIAYQYLKPGGICVAISFHSLEDRIVKRHFHSIFMDEKPNLSFIQKQRLMDKSRVYSTEEIDKAVIRRWEKMYKNVIVPTQEEIHMNTRSRSAKLRAARRLP
ncbi:putative methyltransferase-like protein 15 [Mactra antiquata]